MSGMREETETKHEVSQTRSGPHDSELRGSSHRQLETVSVVMVLHNSADHIDACIKALPDHIELIIVDNDSSDGGAEIVRARRPEAMILSLGANRGFGAGCNAGARSARGEVLVFLNPDTVVEDRCLETLVERLRRTPSGVVGPALLDSDGAPRYVCRRRSRPFHEILELLPLWQRWMPRSWRRDIPAESQLYVAGGAVDYLQGACLAMRRDTFIRIGGFDERFFLYSEEEDLCDRVWEMGGECVYEPRAAVRHVWGASTRKVPFLQAHQLYRSRALLYRKRYGDVGGIVASAGIAFALSLHAAWSPLKDIARGRRPRSVRWCVVALMGLLEGSLARIQSTVGV